MPNLSTSFLEHTVSSIFLNASGVHCTTADEMAVLYAQPLAGGVSKSATPDPRLGNALPRYWDNGSISLNAMGLPNAGLDYYLETASTLPKAPDQIFILSLAGLAIEEHYEMFEAINAIDSIDAVELNLSCPNLADHPIIAYNPPVFERIVKEVKQRCQKPLGIKLPPYFESHQFDTISEILIQYKVQFITTINSIPNALILDIHTERPVIAPKNGLGGLGGPFVKPTTLANIYQFHQRLAPFHIPIIGCGGIQTGADVFEHLLCGASLVQVGSQLAIEGPAVFTRLQDELYQVMARKNYTSVADFQGQLKPPLPVF